MILTAVKTKLSSFIFFYILLLIPKLWAYPGSLDQLMDFEQRYVNRTLDQSKIVALTNYQSQEYSPEAARIFEVKSYWVPQIDTYTFTVSDELSSLGVDFFKKKDNQKFVLLLVHPESESFYSDFTSSLEQGPSFKATATASSRTLLMWPSSSPEKLFFGKLSLNKEIGGVVRTIPGGEVARSVGITKILKDTKGELPQDFKYFPEVLGVMPKNMERGGMIIRSIPLSILKGEVRLIPLFALYTSPNSGLQSPIEKMIQQSQLSAEAFIQKYILIPFAQQWVELVVKNGIAIEAHAQNVLIEIGTDNLPTGKFYYRDFGGFNVDLNYLSNRSRKVVETLPYINGLNKDYHQDFHQDAIRQSLQNYFEGGFLFGLAERLVRSGYPSLNYNWLISLFEENVTHELNMLAPSLFNFQFSFYGTLVKKVSKARNLVQQPVSCEKSLK